MNWDFVILMCSWINAQIAIFAKTYALYLEIWMTMLKRVAALSKGPMRHIQTTKRFI